ncbi:MAG: 4-hydroxy-3-methylbut-2-enyl diphosphate reductase [Bacteroidales bacterium]|nr:4-hydroxy-3-methylbut-2-enyl diphosphate reductase [Bacteroidales bacterium]
MMRIEVEPRSGFCFGVENAISIAEQALLRGETVYSLGSIVHNEQEVERLVRLGLVTIDHKRLRELKNCRVLVRAHGEPPSTYITAAENNIEIIEATCPIVKRLQERIYKAGNETGEKMSQIVIFGKQGHAEVIGLLGQTRGKGILVSETTDIDVIDFNKPVTLYSQTTSSREKYHEIYLAIARGYKKLGKDPDTMIRLHKTICGQVADREPALLKFADSHDVIIFVSGKESSNGNMLFEACRSVNSESYMISAPAEIEGKWFEGKESVGISGATSTPKWLINDARKRIEEITDAGDRANR